MTSRRDSHGRPTRVCVFVDLSGWRIDGLGPDLASERFDSCDEAERRALQHRVSHPEDGELVVRDAYHRVLAVVARDARGRG